MSQKWSFQWWHVWEDEYQEEAVASAPKSFQTYGNCKQLCTFCRHTQLPLKLPGTKWLYPGIEFDLECLL